ncbi:hypothetical protein Pse7367_1526 [Thalassoporum mexicanum PCC 7367]|uniref:hypothetical protein n=1 Tax=Thalassoporum mexicanum TaxID=3457544 RepID=UPI00029FAB6E|nr:hypothetical protein [Pseudanabaena sp. PCC 7367]AFY69815.1 hypothetical protein Pse7367_1526 [Pseudanabaena sp. PCC 7367]
MTSDKNQDNNPNQRERDNQEQISKELGQITDKLDGNTRITNLVALGGLVVGVLTVVQSFQVSYLNNRLEEEKRFTNALFNSIQFIEKKENADLAMFALATIPDETEEMEILFGFVLAASKTRPDLLRNFFEVCDRLPQQKKDICDELVADRRDQLEDAKEGVDAAIAENDDQKSGLPDIAVQAYELSQDTQDIAPNPTPIAEPLWMYLTRMNDQNKIGDGLLTVVPIENKLASGIIFKPDRVIGEILQADTNVNLRSDASTINTEVVQILKTGACVEVKGITERPLTNEAQAPTGGGGGAIDQAQANPSEQANQSTPAPNPESTQLNQEEFKGIWARVQPAACP